jgi:oligopeptide transport system substrate-binding protein
MDVSKQALVELYGLTYGEGEKYADLDEAYAAITGYDMAEAKKLMAEAYEECVKDGLYVPAENKTVSIELAVYQSDTIYQNMYTYVKDQIVEATKGTPFEGKVTVTMRVDADYYNTCYAGKTDMIFSTWGGATYGTLGLLSRVYCDDYTGNGNQMEVGFKTDAVELTLEVAGVEITSTLKGFADWLNGSNLPGLKAYHEYSYEVQAEVLAACEKAFLSHYSAIPLYYRQSASLVSQKITYPTNTYINLVGFGGLREIRYNYNDNEWKALKASGLSY